MSSSRRVINEVLEIDSECFPNDPLTEEELKGLLQRAGMRLYIASGKSGYALAHHGEELCTLLRIGVRKEKQGFGHAKALLHSVAEESKTPIVLRVSEQNRTAIALYYSAGFVVEGYLDGHLFLTFEKLEMSDRKPRNESRSDHQEDCMG